MYDEIESVSTTIKNVKKDIHKIIVIQSDHGSNFIFKEPSYNTFPDADMLTERMNNINFIYLPNSTDIPDSITPVNTFRIIFNHYFKTNLEILDDRSYILNGDKFDDITEMIGEKNWINTFH